MIYKLRPNEGSSVIVLPDPMGLMDEFEAAGEASLRASWVPPRIEVVTEIDGLPREPVDLYLSGTPWLIVNERALDALRDLLERNGEVLPIASPYAAGFLAPSRQEALFLHRTQHVDCLDLSRSEVRRFANSDRVMAIERPVLDLDRLGGAEMFRLPEARGVILVTQTVVDLVKASGLSGLAFRPYFDPASA